VPEDKQLKYEVYDATALLQSVLMYRTILHATPIQVYQADKLCPQLIEGNYNYTETVARHGRTTHSTHWLQPSVLLN